MCSVKSPAAKRWGMVAAYAGSPPNCLVRPRVMRIVRLSPTRTLGPSTASIHWREAVSTYTKIFLYPTLEFAQCRMLWDDDHLRHGARHKNGLRADSTAAGVQRRCDSSKG